MSASHQSPANLIGRVKGDSRRFHQAIGNRPSTSQRRLLDQCPRKDRRHQRHRKRYRHVGDPILVGQRVNHQLLTGECVDVGSIGIVAEPVVLQHLALWHECCQQDRVAKRENDRLTGYDGVCGEYREQPQGRCDAPIKPNSVPMYSGNHAKHEGQAQTCEVGNAARNLKYLDHAVCEAEHHNCDSKCAGPVQHAKCASQQHPP